MKRSTLHLYLVRRLVFDAQPGKWHVFRRMVLIEEKMLVRACSCSQTVAAPLSKLWAFPLKANTIALCTPGLPNLEELGVAIWVFPRPEFLSVIHL